MNGYQFMKISLSKFLNKPGRQYVYVDASTKYANGNRDRGQEK